MEERFDMSGYIDRPLPIGKNKKVIGLMKDELGEKIMMELVALRAKLYSYRIYNEKEEPKKCKGIKKCVAKKRLKFEDYIDCLFNDNDAYRSQLMFQSRRHNIHTVEGNKIALNRNDDKRKAKKDVVSTLACGHKSLCWNPLLGEIVL